MRFAEKSFEVRFCAAFSAAIMPFNRNPLWLGMTQAQERKIGLDTILQIGGCLYLFQFKAKQNGKFQLQSHQCKKLGGIERKYPKSTHYVLPEPETTSKAASLKCILEHSWLCSPVAISSAFKLGALTAQVGLDPVKGYVTKERPKLRIPAKSVCSRMGCFCPPIVIPAVPLPGSRRGIHLYLSRTGAPLNGALQSNPLDENGLVGIPIGDTDERGEESVRSSEAFENLLDETGNAGTMPWLMGLFLPSGESEI